MAKEEDKIKELEDMVEAIINQVFSEMNPQEEETDDASEEE